VVVVAAGRAGLAPGGAALDLVQLTSQLWVSFDKGGQVAVLQGAGPHGVLGAENITRVEPFGTNRQELPRSPLLADALEDGIGVGDRAEGEQLAQCLPPVFTPTADTGAAAQEQCADAIADTPLQLPARHHPIPGTTEHTPAVAATDDKVVVAWTDGNNYRLQAGRSRNGTDVEPLGPLGEEFESDQEPALAADGDRFFLAWRDQDEHVALASSTDGEDFGEPVVLDTTTTKTAPALAYGNGTLLLAWVDGNNQLHLWRRRTPTRSSSFRSRSCPPPWSAARPPRTSCSRRRTGTSPGPGPTAR
jgi:hypothetical protein